MIRIFVKGQELALYRDTTMTVELNNALFASPDIEGDISFSFSLPIRGNEQALGFVHLTQADKPKRLPCSVYCYGGHKWNGELLIQKCVHESITAALIINPYPEDFASRMITKNEDGEIVISESKDSHDHDWEEFLKASVNNRDVKFAPFFNEEGYGSANDNYGFWHGYSRNRIVNALFFTSNGELIDNSYESPFSKVHCEEYDVQIEDDEETDEDESSSYVETNQLAFCPQIRLARIMEIWCKNAGYTFINHLGDDLNKTYVQSQKSLDGSLSQYIPNGLTINSETNGIMETNGCFRYKLNEMDDGSFVTTQGDIRPTQSGWWELELIPTYTSQQYNDTLNHWANHEYSGNTLDSVVLGYGFHIAVFYGNVNLQTITISENVLKSWKCDMQPKKTTIYFNATMATTGVRFVMWCKKKWGNGYAIQQVGLKWIINMHQLSHDTEMSGFNIFRNKFRIPETLPEVTNAAFLKTILETAGLCYFVSGKKRTIEIVPYSALKTSKNLDLTQYVLTRETETTQTDDKKQTFRLPPLKDDSFNEDLRLDDVEMQLPDEYNNHEHYILRTKTNTLYRAVKLEHETTNWQEEWQEHSGNPDKLEVGTGDEESHEPGVKIPHQRLWEKGSIQHNNIDIATGETPQLMVADFTICSDLYNQNEKPSDIILTQYRGFREREFTTMNVVGPRDEVVIYNPFKHELMLPVWNGEFSLTAKGANSLGERYVKPVLQLANHRVINYTLRLPEYMMQPVEDLLRPSSKEPGMQTRYIIVDNVKSVPKRITFQIDNTIDKTVLCKIEAVKVY